MRRGTLRWIVLSACLSLLSFSTARAEDKRAPALDKQLFLQAPKILEYAREKGYKNLGVLKFRVKKGKEPVSDNVGTLNMFLANRLEVALVLANTSDPKKQVGIVKRASSVAAKIPGANHATEEGRKKLFTDDYPLAWGKESVKPDAFLTGIVAVTPDLRQMTVGILVFDREGKSLEKVVPAFNAPTSAFLMNEMGESFVLRGAFDSANVNVEAAQEKAIEAAAEVKTKEATHPLVDTASPVSLEVYYDDRPAKIEFRDGKAFVPEPEEGQRVMLLLKKPAASQQRFAVVLKVNGENTLEREKMRDVDCHKWILDSVSPQIRVLGFQMNDDLSEEFRVLSREESKANEMHYGADVGTISMVVFREKGAPSTQVATNTPGNPPAPNNPKPETKNNPPADLPADLPNDEAEDVAALTRGLLPKEQPKNLAALKHQLREGGRKAADTRGLIVQGRTTVNRTRTLQFQADPTPVMSATLIYYKP